MKAGVRVLQGRTINNIAIITLIHLFGIENEKEGDVGLT